MSIISNHQPIETAINSRRINEGLRILWPDYQIYDLLSEGMTKLEVSSYATFPPYIVQLPNEEAINSCLQIMQDYTHLAIKSQLQIDQKLQTYKGYTVFLTKRNLAVDSILHKYSRGKHILTLQVAQLSRQFSFWGIQAMTESLKTVGPKHISKRKATWILQYEFDHSLKSIICYSTRRQPSYGKNQNHFDLPRDALKQSCLKFRSYASVMDYYLQKEGEESLVTFNGMLPRVPLKKFMINKKSQESNELQQEKQAIQLMQMKCKITEPYETKGHHNHLKLIKIREVKSETFLTQERENSYRMRLECFLCKLQSIMSDLWNNCGHVGNLQHNVFNQNTVVQQIKNYQKGNQLDKLALLEKYQETTLESVQEFLLSQSILELAKRSISEDKCEINRNFWIRLYSLVKKLKREDLITILIEVLQKILVVQSRQLLKDSEEDLQKLHELMGQDLRTCLIQALQFHEQNQMLCSDILFILMKVQKSQNFIQLFKKYPLQHGSFMLTGSLSAYIQHLEMPCSEQLDLIYEHKCELNYITYQQTVNNGEQKVGKSQRKYKRYQIQIDRFSDVSFLVSKIFTCSNKLFKIYIYKKQESVFVFVEYLGQKQCNKNKNSFQSFEVIIQLDVNQKQYIRKIGWNFSMPSQSIGFNIKSINQDINYLSCIVYTKPQIVHQCLMNYMAIRYVQLFKFPSQIAQIQSKENIQNQRLSKRRSTFELENLFCENTLDTLLQNCYFHKKCEKCDNFPQSQTVYTIDEIDMFSLLLSLNFKREIHSLMCLGKYLLFKNLSPNNQEFMKHCLRLSYLPLLDLFHTYNRHVCEYPLIAFLKALIEHKLKNIGCQKMQDKADQKFIFMEKGRSLTQMLMHIQKDFSGELLEYLQRSK